MLKHKTTDKVTSISRHHNSLLVDGPSMRQNVTLDNRMCSRSGNRVHGKQDIVSMVHRLLPHYHSHCAAAATNTLLMN